MKFAPVPSLAAVLAVLPSTALADEVGYADLHAHPMSHLAFGYNEGPCVDSEGIFHGKPGGALDPADPDKDILEDLGTCQTDTHSTCPTTLVERRIRTWLLALLENRLLAHGAAGAPSFEFWPHALSRTHQQMHVKWLRQAYDSGLRVMIASVTDAELLGRIYHFEEWADCTVPKPEEGYLHESAVRQIEGLRNLADENSDWLVIAEDPDTALEAAFGDEEKLVLVLGVEMDYLTDDEVLDLVDNHGVRSVIPVHLVNNSVGGAAVYDDLFNSMNRWANGLFYDVEEDPALSSRMANPEEIVSNWVPFAGCGFAIEPGGLEYQDPDACEPPAAGHRNRCGLRSNELLHQLMRRGVIVDVAHMSWATAEDTIRMAELQDYPVINSHTGLRDETALGKNERAMTFDHSRRIAALGGMIGLGTVGEPPSDDFFGAKGSPLLRLSEEQPEWVGHHLPTDTRDAGDRIESLKVRVQTGGDNLENDSAADLFIDAGGTRRMFELKAPEAGTFDDWAVAEVDIEVTPGIQVADIDAIGIMMKGDESWNIDRLDVTYSGTTPSGDPTGHMLVSRGGFPWARLTNGEVSTTIRPVQPREEVSRNDRVERIFFEWDASFHNPLSQGWGGGASGFRIHLRDGRTLERAFAAMDMMDGTANFGTGFSSFLWELEDCGGVPYGDIVGIEAVVEGLSDYQEISVEHLHMMWEGSDVSGSAVEGTFVDSDLAGGLGDRHLWLRRDRRTASLWRGLDPLHTGSFSIETVSVAFQSGGDDLEAGSEATLEFLLRDGSTVSRSLNRGRKWEADSPNHGFVPPIDPIEYDDIVTVRVASDGAGGISHDNWNLASFELARVKDPMQPWVDSFREARMVLDAATADEGLLALGTDFNGLETQMPFVSIEDPDDSETLPNLPFPDVPRGDATGDRVFSLENDGLAHYGMLKDFVDHLWGVDTAVGSELYSSAPHFVHMWQAAAERASELPEEAPPLASVGTCGG